MSLGTRIIGSGMGGLAAAALARQGQRVLVPAQHGRRAR